MLGHVRSLSLSFFFNDTATTEIYTLSLHDALPILAVRLPGPFPPGRGPRRFPRGRRDRKSTRLNSSHRTSSYAVFCLKKKKIQKGGVQPELDEITMKQNAESSLAGDDAASLRRLLETLENLDDVQDVYFFVMIGRPPSSTLFPYTTLFR